MQLLNSGLDLREILSHVAAAISEEIIQCNVVGIYLPEPDGTLRGCVGKPDNISGIKLTEMVIDAKADLLVTEIMATRCSVYIPDTSLDNRPDPRPIQIFRIKSLLAVPIVTADSVIGIVFLFNYDAPLALTPAQIQSVEAYVSMAAAAIQIAKLLNHTQDLLAEKQLLLELIRKLSMCTNSEEALETCFYYLGEVLKNQNIAAHLYDEIEGEFRPVKMSKTSSWHEVDWKAVHAEEKLDYDNDELFKEVIQSKQSVFVPDISCDPRPNQKLCQAFGIKGMFFMPLVATGQVLGVVAVVSFEQTKEYSIHQKQLAQMIVDATAISVSNLKRMEYLEWAVEKRTKELQDINTRIKHQASHDVLTGLPNRRKYSEQLRAALVNAAGKRKIAVMFLDLDQFKNINDALGHDAGDSLLIEVANRLGQCMPNENTIGRMGGDEFTIILPDVKDRQQVEAVGQEILEAFESPFLIGDYEIRISFSIGISIYPYDGENVESLTKHADIAMYRAKELGGGRVQFYSPKMSLQPSGQLELEKDLRKAIEAEELLLHYQPLINLQTGIITGVEALIRWRHPKHGLIYPDRFIPYAEHTQLILPIGRWVLETACIQNKAWSDAGIGSFRVSVNLSARQLLDSKLTTEVEQILHATGMAADHLELEITESVILQRVDSVLETIRKLRQLGVHIAIDDFGTGYSSLSHLKHFPIDSLKIDKSFIGGLAKEPRNASIVAAIIAFSKSLNLRSVAEGIENVDDLAFLRRNGCAEGQGYWFSKPLSAEGITDLLGKTNGWGFPVE